jgi:hypothetical protein
MTMKMDFTTDDEVHLGARYMPALGTGVIKAEYDWVSRTGRLYMPEDCCCDQDAMKLTFSQPRARGRGNLAATLRMI